MPTDKARCGTTTGYSWHQRHDERPCDACARAKADYDTRWSSAPRRRQIDRLNATAQGRALRELSKRYPHDYRQLYLQHKSELLAVAELAPTKSDQLAEGAA